MSGIGAGMPGNLSGRVRRKVRLSLGDKVFYRTTEVVITLFFLIVLYPLIYVVSSSFSGGRAVLAGRVVLWPVDFGVEGYRIVFQYKEVFRSFFNSVGYTTLGTTINIAMTMMCAYALARRTLPFRNIFMFLFTFTMFFNGGMIPNYMLIRNLGIMNTVWALVLPGAISVYNMIIARTFMQSTLPNEMLEAAQIDGCNDVRFFFQMVLPLSKAIIAVLCVYYVVGHWNSWFNAFLYINGREKYPLQLVLREILINNTFDANRQMDPELVRRMQGISDLMKYSLIVIASTPMMLVYPFAQKFFVRGVMIGSIKG
ncbi:MAG: carbohydrate ABC transporter permease [Oscillospiraceae bacterium]|nr:carbohydrate ABC transporter permease [Oscillospiraceae bacterium]